MTRILLLAFLFASGEASHCENWKQDPVECENWEALDADDPDELFLPRTPIFSSDHPEINSSDLRILSIINYSFLWPNNTIVYEFDRNLLDSFKDTFHEAIAHIKGRTCIRFKEQHRRSEKWKPDYIYVTQDPSTQFSPIGMRGSKQDFFVRYNAYSLRHFLHELGHAIGLHNEEIRADRDQFVTINWENIIEDYTYNFDTFPALNVSTSKIPYDYWSVMHSARDSYSNNGKDTVTPMDPDVQIGVVDRLSVYDIRKINDLYCPGTMGVRFQNVENRLFLDARNLDGRRTLVTAMWTGRDSQKWTTDWDELRNNGSGTLIWSWDQAETGFGHVDVLMSPHNYTVELDKHNIRHRGGREKLWKIIRKRNVSETVWQIKNKRNQLCLQISSIHEFAMVGQVECKNIWDPWQLWRIYSA